MSQTQNRAAIISFTPSPYATALNRPALLLFYRSLFGAEISKPDFG
tara:strand:- start:356 stop:493 length:138 start_codon:yes stop_codon:yes gene_type:complete